MSGVKPINVSLDGEEVKPIEQSEITKTVENTVELEPGVFEYTLRTKIFIDADKKMPVTKVVVSEPIAGRMKTFKTTDQTMNDMLIMIFASSDIQHFSTVEKLRFRDVMNLIRISTSFLG